MATAAAFLIAREWKQPQSPLTEKGINRVCCVHTGEEYAATNRKRVQIGALTYMDPGAVMLSERSQSEKPRVVGFRPHEGLTTGKSIETESRLAVAGPVSGSECRSAQGFILVVRMFWDEREVYSFVQMC